MSLYELRLLHRAGSLDAYVGGIRMRNLAISLGIILLLGVSFTLLLISRDRALRLAQQQLQFVASVSHELRTPVSVLKSAGENLSDGMVADGARLREYGTVINREATRLGSMVEQVLQYARISSGNLPLQLRPVSLHDVVQAALRASRTAIDEAGVTVEVDLPADLPPVYGDARALQTAVENLLSNAVKYRGEDPWIGIEAGRDEHGHANTVHLSMRDRGIGIMRAEQRRIFEPFVRGKDAVAGQIHGSGLGLSIVKRLVEAGGGTVRVHSTPGVGSTFVITLPVANDDQAVT